MAICPVCEHQQDFGLECEVCGKELGGLGDLGPPPVAAVPLEGLEVTVPDQVGDVSIEAVAGLELNRQENPEVAVAPMGELDRGRAEGVPDMPAARMPELQMDRAPDDGVRTALPQGAITCRYCRNVQAVGLICEKCGMRLARGTAPAAQAAARPSESTRCRACGAPAKAGQRCNDCGRDVPFPDA